MALLVQIDVDDPFHGFFGFGMDPNSLNPLEPAVSTSPNLLPPELPTIDNPSNIRTTTPVNDASPATTLVDFSPAPIVPVDPSPPLEATPLADQPITHDRSSARRKRKPAMIQVSFTKRKTHTWVTHEVLQGIGKHYVWAVAHAILNETPTGAHTVSELWQMMRNDKRYEEHLKHMRVDNLRYELSHRKEDFERSCQTKRGVLYRLSGSVHHTKEFCTYRGFCEHGIIVPKEIDERLSSVGHSESSSSMALVSPTFREARDKPMSPIASPTWTSLPGLSSTLSTPEVFGGTSIPPTPTTPVTPLMASDISKLCITYNGLPVINGAVCQIQPAAIGLTTGEPLAIPVPQVDGGATPMFDDQDLNALSPEKRVLTVQAGPGWWTTDGLVPQDPTAASLATLDYTSTPNPPASSTLGGVSPTYMYLNSLSFDGLYDPGIPPIGHTPWSPAPTLVSSSPWTEEVPLPTMYPA